MSRARFPGEKHPMAKLTKAQVIEIFDLLSTGKWSSSRLAKRFGISEATIDRIRTGDLWKSVRPDGWHAPRLLTKAGELHSRARLNPDQVLDIRKRALAGESIVKLGNEFGVHYCTIYQIKYRITWKHLKDEP